MSAQSGPSELRAVVTRGGTRLAYESFGDPRDPPLFLIQGLSAQMLGWHPELCAALAAEGLFVVRFDNRDVGASQRFPDVSYRISDMADDTAGLIEALGYEAVHVVGQSMGGMIAQRLAVEHPGRVRSLGLIYTVSSMEYYVGGDTISEREAASDPRDREEAIDLYVRNEEPCGSSGYERDVEWLRVLGGAMWDRGYDAEGVKRQSRAIAAQPDLRDGLDEIRVPTVILHGDADRLLSHNGSEEISRLIVGSKFHVYPGMGHELPRELWLDIVARIVSNLRMAS